ncbi:50S ribosomal protein L24e [Candidatus Micrarchaeota archaeon]|nr:50S ribosomal protein L24e [Candidatus Micrarchaeota archaeon]
MQCSFCKVECEKGTGSLFVKKDGVILGFCTTKCRKNMLGLKRNPRKVKWIRKMRK